MTDDIVAELIRRRLEKPFTGIDEIKDILPDDNLRKNILSTRSYIFKVSIRVEVESTRAEVTAYYNRDNNQILYWIEE